MTITQKDFNQAVERLLGEAYYQRLLNQYQTHQFCSEVAHALLTQRLKNYPEQAQDLALVCSVAERLWHGDGTTGFEMQSKKSVPLSGDLPGVTDI